MTNMIEKFKENKKVMVTKMEMANKMANEAADEFVNSLKHLAENASEEDIEEFINSDDDMIDKKDKLALIAMFADTHKFGGVAIIDFRRK